MLTYVDLQSQVLTYIDQVNDLGRGRDLVQIAIKSAYERRLTEERWSFMLWPYTVSLPLVPGKDVYTLHPLALMLEDFKTPNGKMHETPSRARYDAGNCDYRHFEFIKPSPVRVQPTVAGTVTITGWAQIDYVDTNGNELSEEIVNGDTANSVSQITRITKMDGNPLTVVDHASVNLLTLSGIQFGISYPQIRLFADPQTDTATYRFYKRPQFMVADRDIPDIPFPFSRIIVYDALMEMAAYNDAPPHPYWIQQQQLWDLQMRQAFQEGEMAGSVSRRIHVVDHY